MSLLSARFPSLKRQAFFAVIATIAFGFIAHFIIYISPSIREASLPTTAATPRIESVAIQEGTLRDAARIHMHGRERTHL